MGIIFFDYIEKYIYIYVRCIYMKINVYVYRK